jgi:hypothetical protein
MKRVLVFALAAGVIVTAVCLSRGTDPPNAAGDRDVRVAVEARNPWTHLRLNNDPDTFRFLIVSDRTGGHRAGVFSRAVEQINLLQPEFVLSVGDLIEGYATAEKIREEWKEFQGFVSRLQMPFFYVPGNHDVIMQPTAGVWQERFGRRYYHFTYKNVLFLVLNPYDGEPAKVRDEAYYKTRFSDAQLAYVKKALAENAHARWTVVALHAPVWTGDVVGTRWLEVEKLLAGRNYTVFCGHIHRYQKFVRQGMNYYQLATTGGGSTLRGVEYGEFDHIVWVTMKKTGPVLANVLLDGVYREDLSRPVTDEPGNIPGYGKQVVAVRGAVSFEGTPTPGAEVQFSRYDKAAGRSRGFAQGRVEADGGFRLTSFKAFDGAEPGEYQVTVTWRVPALNEDGKPGPNRLPARYADRSQSGLTATVTAEGPNVFRFALTKEPPPAPEKK